MMASWKVLSTLFIFGCQLCYAQGQLKIMTEDWPPMNYRQDGVALGNLAVENQLACVCWLDSKIRMKGTSLFGLI